MKSSAKSLWIQLGLALVASSLVAIAVASVILYAQFKSTNSTFREHTLRNEVHVIGKYLRRVRGDAPLSLPPELLQAFQEASGKYAIVDDKGTVLTATPGVTAPLSIIDPTRPLDYFVLESDTDGPLYGLSSAAELRGKRVWVQVAFVASDILFDFYSAGFPRRRCLDLDSLCWDTHRRQSGGYKDRSSTPSGCGPTGGNHWSECTSRCAFRRTGSPAKSWLW